MRRLAAVLLSVAVLFGSTSAAFAAPPAPAARITLDASPVSAQVIMENGRSLAPAQALGEAMGFAVRPNPADNRVSLVGRETTIELWVDSTRAVADGNELTLDTATRVVDGQYYVPVRFVAERFGLRTGWDQASGTVTLTSPRGMLAQIQAAQSNLVDQELSADFALTASGLSLGNNRPVVLTQLSTHMDTQVFKGDMWITSSTRLPAKLDLLGAIPTTKAVKDGILWEEDPFSGKWTEKGPYDPVTKRGRLTGAGSELVFATGLESQLLNLDRRLNDKVRVEYGRDAELDGTSVVRVDLNMPTAEPIVLSSGTPKGSVGVSNVQVQVDRFAVSYWFDPAAQLVRKTTFDIRITTALTAGTRTLSSSTSYLGEVRAKPFAGPILFPDFKAGPPELSPEKLQEVTDYWTWLKEAALPGECSAAANQAEAYWARKDYAGARDAAARSAQCLAGTVQVLDARRPPVEFAQAHGVIQDGVETMATAMEAMVQAGDLALSGDAAAAADKYAEADSLLAKGAAQVLQGAVQANKAATKLGLEE